MEIKIQIQPDDASCGPTCLSPMLGKHALEQGFQASIYDGNLLIIEPEES